MNIVYLITDTVTQIKYIGSKKDYQGDGTYFGSPSAKKSHKKYQLQQNWIKATHERPETFKLEILEKCKESDLIDRELFWQLTFDVVNSDEFINAGMCHKQMSYKGLNKGKTVVFNIETKQTEQICVEDFDDNIHVHINKGKIRVYKTGSCKSFLVNSNDPGILNGTLIPHAKGFVTVKDTYGNTKRVSVDDPLYKSGKLVHIQKGMVNVVNENGISKRISVEEYKSGKFKTALTNHVMVKDTSGNTKCISVDDPLYKSGEYQSIHKGFVTVKDTEGNTKRVSVDDPLYKSGKLMHNTTGLTVAIDKNGNTFSVSKNDPRFKTGEIQHMNKNIVIGIDTNGNNIRVHKNDPRFKTGELKHINTGRWNWRKVIVIEDEENTVKFFANKYSIKTHELKNYLEVNKISYKIKKK